MKSTFRIFPLISWNRKTKQRDQTADFLRVSRSPATWTGTSLFVHVVVVVVDTCLLSVAVGLWSPRNLRVSDEWYTRFRVAWDPVTAPVQGYRLTYSPAGETTRSAGPRAARLVTFWWIVVLKFIIFFWLHVDDQTSLFKTGMMRKIFFSSLGTISLSK